MCTWLTSPVSQERAPRGRHCSRPHGRPLGPSPTALRPGSMSPSRALPTLSASANYTERVSSVYSSFRVPSLLVFTIQFINKPLGGTIATANWTVENCAWLFVLLTRSDPLYYLYGECSNASRPSKNQNPVCVQHNQKQRWKIMEIKTFNKAMVLSFYFNNDYVWAVYFLFMCEELIPPFENWL